VPLREGRTLHHDVAGRHRRRRCTCGGPARYRIIAGGPMRAVFETLGMQDVVAKIARHPTLIICARNLRRAKARIARVGAARRNIKCRRCRRVAASSRQRASRRLSWHMVIFRWTQKPVSTLRKICESRHEQDRECHQDRADRFRFGRHHTQRETLIGLGLNGIGASCSCRIAADARHDLQVSIWCGGTDREKAMKMHDSPTVRARARSVPHRAAASAPAPARPAAAAARASARSGVRIKGFEGGQMPLHRRLPKRGFRNTAFALEMNEVNLDKFRPRSMPGKLDAAANRRCCPW